MSNMVVILMVGGAVLIIYFRLRWLWRKEHNNPSRYVAQKIAVYIGIAYIFSLAVCPFYTAALIEEDGAIRTAYCRSRLYGRTQRGDTVLCRVTIGVVRTDRLLKVDVLPDELFPEDWPIDPRIKGRATIPIGFVIVSTLETMSSSSRTSYLVPINDIEGTVMFTMPKLY